MAFEISTLSHLVNIVTKNLRESGCGYLIPKDEVESELRWCWECNESEITKKQYEHFEVYNPINTVTWWSKANRYKTTEEFLEEVRQLRYDYGILNNLINDMSDYTEYERSNLVGIVPARIFEKIKPSPLGMQRNSTDKAFSEKFKSLVEEAEDRSGVYFMYNAEDELVYVGRSINLSSRVVTSAIERDAEKVEIAYTETKSDSSLYESYYISKLKPSLNVEGKFEDRLSVSLPDIRTHEIINVFQEVNEMEAE